MVICYGFTWIYGIYVSQRIATIMSRCMFPYLGWSQDEESESGERGSHDEVKRGFTRIDAVADPSKQEVLSTR